MSDSNRKVMIGTASYSGKIDANYVFSLSETKIKCLMEYNIDVVPIFMCYDALIQNSRNTLMQIAYDAQVDDLIFIDDDIGWEPNDFIKLLNHNVNVVGGTYRKKHDNIEEYVCTILKDNKFKREDNGLIKVKGLGTGFLRLSKKAIKLLYDNSKEYFINGGQEKRKLIFEIGFNDQMELVSEDIFMCLKLQQLGMNVYFDPTITCIHVGQKVYKGNFIEYEKRLNLSSL